MNKELANFISFIEKMILFVILISTLVAILFELLKMIENRYVSLADTITIYLC